MFYNSEPCVEDVVELAVNLRAADQMEAHALGYEDPLEALADSVEGSSACFAIRDTESEEVVGLWGFSEDDEGGAQVWAVGTDDMVASPLSLHKMGLEMRDGLFQAFDVLYNRVHKWNRAHIAWLERLGAEFYPSDSPSFLYFEIREKWTP